MSRSRPTEPATSSGSAPGSRRRQQRLRVLRLGQRRRRLVDHSHRQHLIRHARHRATQALANGDKIAIRIVGSVVTALHYTQRGGGSRCSATTRSTTRLATRRPVAGARVQVQHARRLRRGNARLRLPAREYGLADGQRHTDGGAAADRVAGHLDGFAGTDVHVSVAALRQQGANCSNIGGATDPRTRSSRPTSAPPSSSRSPASNTPAPAPSPPTPPPSCRRPRPRPRTRCRRRSAAHRSRGRR